MSSILDINNIRIAIVGLGYVGLPLAVEFGKIRETIGFDVSKDRVNELLLAEDKTQEVPRKDLLSAKYLKYSHRLKDISDCNCFIITVPTPIDDYNKPDLSPLKFATTSIGSILKRGDIVIYESTVYPGTTEEVCVPILEKESNLEYNKDFFCGYSPERINPGDKEHRLINIKKVTSGSNKSIANLIDQLYRQIIIAGTHLTSSIKVAEAAKVIENTQRDINIALINELAIIFNLLNINTQEVLDAAGTKWNFLPFKPGLVGGHCISVDPYYLTYKAQKMGYTPEVILAGRRLNDSMGKYVVSQLIKKMIQKNIKVDGASVLILGFTFKENCPDMRNTRVVDIHNELKEYGCNVDIFDPIADSNQSINEYNIDLIDKPKKGNYSAVVIAVSHDYFKKLSFNNIKNFCDHNSLIYDLKNVIESDKVDIRL